jgi:hypothetical protein
MGILKLVCRILDSHYLHSRDMQRFLKVRQLVAVAARRKSKDGQKQVV